ncbi:sensor histidine kinase [Acanthopleuribacter pedis]|uniref:histidine kinase n=1 Tax=Acanthopleuribacter pedis TaxID=442870 RepID=A0A8J7QA06_9BACT|nr:HAMP domain-containing sensor histidine kinase [Acanthopleuribacter pedis]MBO1320532.1 HAMP domain-containing histidine kinase [Acanthopleuribacter pedis]
MAGLLDSLKNGLAGFSARQLMGWGGVLCCLPLGLLLLMQYRWLTHVEAVTREAERANMAHFLDIVAEKTETHYRQVARDLVQLPPALLVGPLPPLLQHYQSIPREQLESVRFLFHMSFVGEFEQESRVFDPDTGDWAKQLPDSTYKKINLSAIHWWAWHKKKLDGAPAGLVTSHYLPNHPIIMKRIPNAEGTVIGLVGIVLDDAAFERFLADTLPATLAATFPGSGKRVEVTDPGGSPRFETEPLIAGGAQAKVTRPFAMVFTDWRIAVHTNGGPTPGLAVTTLTANALVSLLLVAAVALGIGFTMRTALNYRQLSDMKSDFVSNVSHELRTPIASIRVFGELMRDGKIASMEKVAEYGRFIEEETRRLGGLIDNILDFSKIESGQKHYRPVETDLIPLAETIIRGFEQGPGRAGIAFKRNFPQTLPPIKLDANAVGRALLNLLDNAVKYGPSEQTIEIGLRLEADRVLLWVKDQAGGIPAGEQARIFERFHRIPTGAVHQVRGSGLGLAITKHIVEGHGGRMGLTSEEGVGSCFEMNLPIDGGTGEHGAQKKSPHR